MTKYRTAINGDEAGSGVTVVWHNFASTSVIIYTSLNVDVAWFALEDETLLPLSTCILTERGMVEYSTMSLVPISDKGVVVPTQVSYVGKCGQVYAVGEEVSSGTLVVSRFLGTGYT